MFYVEVNGTNSIFLPSESGTIQGSILGPILYAIFVAPLFDITDLFNFADDNFSLSISPSKDHAVQLITEKLIIITTWLKDSGLSINEKKQKHVSSITNPYHPST